MKLINGKKIEKCSQCDYAYLAGQFLVCQKLYEIVPPEKVSTGCQYLNVEEKRQSQITGYMPSDQEYFIEGHTGW